MPDQQPDQQAHQQADALADRVVAFHGVGVMGAAVLAALVASGHPPEQVLAIDTYQAGVDAVVEQHGVRAATAAEAAQQADVHVLAVKPADVPAVLATLSEAAGHEGRDAVVVSVAAGATTAALEAGLPDGMAVVRVMPNTPAVLGAGMSVVSRGSAADDESVRLACALLGTAGEVLELPEKQLDAVTATSGSGPAYVFYLAEAMIEGAVLQGLSRPVARQLTLQTILGSARMLVEGEDSPTVLRERVSSPGGTTMAAVATLDAHATRAAVVDAIRAATERSVELGA